MHTHELAGRGLGERHRSWSGALRKSACFLAGRRVSPSFSLSAAVAAAVQASESG